MSEQKYVKLFEEFVNEKKDVSIIEGLYRIIDKMHRTEMNDDDLGKYLEQVQSKNSYKSKDFKYTSGLIHKLFDKFQNAKNIKKNKLKQSIEKFLDENDYDGNYVNKTIVMKLVNEIGNK